MRSLALTLFFWDHFAPVAVVVGLFLVYYPSLGILCLSGHRLKIILVVSTSRQEEFFLEICEAVLQKHWFVCSNL